MGVFAVDTVEWADIEWSPDDSAILIWDSPLEYESAKSCSCPLLSMLKGILESSVV